MKIHSILAALCTSWASCHKQPEPVLAARFGATSPVSTDAVFGVRCSAFTGTVVAEQSERGDEWAPAVFRDGKFHCEDGRWGKLYVMHSALLVRLRIAAYVSGSISFTEGATQ